MSKPKDKECSKHGLTPHSKRKNKKGWRCRKCAVEAVQRRREKIKSMLLKYKGDKCEICGYDKCSNSLHFHHINEEEKSFGISHKGKTRSWKRVKKELDKCILVCANCHGEIHAGIIQW